MNGWIEWLCLALGATVFFCAFVVLLIVVVIKLRARGRADAPTPAPPAFLPAPIAVASAPAEPVVRGSLRRRMEAEDAAEAERIAEALYTAREYYDRQGKRNKEMLSIVAGLGTPGSTPPPNA